MSEINSSTTSIKFVTIDELASIFGVSRSTVKNWRARRIIKPCIAIGGVVRFDPSECKRKLADFGGSSLK
ncbi:helix-turn-helix domain-containing protein [Methylobacterium sp. AMS5]|uniref:helix-turn-helix transcriptional regulator n=1 Tax=Methylobacterium sp. AMS5 TaxID=925818 RepID=UPI0009FA42B3